jgi:hypothetical protein
MCFILHWLYGAFIARELAKWTKVAREAGAKVIETKPNERT